MLKNNNFLKTLWFGYARLFQFLLLLTIFHVLIYSVVTFTFIAWQLYYDEVNVSLYLVPFVIFESVIWYYVLSLFFYVAASFLLSILSILIERYSLYVFFSSYKIEFILCPSIVGAYMAWLSWYCQQPDVMCYI